MRRTDVINTIKNELDTIGLGELGSSIEKALNAVSSSSEVMDGVVNAVKVYSSVEREKRSSMLLKRSMIPEPAYMTDLWDYKARKLDHEQIEFLLDLPFMKEKHNLIIDGPSGTGKSWFAAVLATKACQEGKRVKWVSFPKLVRDLSTKVAKGGNAFDSRIKYYTNFDLICLDEFLNLKPEQLIDCSYILEEFADAVRSRKVPMIVTAQLATEKMEQLFNPIGIGDSIKGRILGKAAFLHLTGPNLNFYKPGPEENL